MRFLYRTVLQLHPPYFRRQFAGEMLWIFDQASGTLGAFALFLDGLGSLARQWLLRSGWWKVLAALALATFQMVLGGLGTQLFRPHHLARLAGPEDLSTSLAVPGPIAHQPMTVGILMTLAVSVLFGLLVMIIGLNAWVKRARRVR